MAELVSLSTTDANNTGTTFGMAESIAPSVVNNRYRAFQGAVARDFNDKNGSLVSAGTANAQTLAINSTTAAAAAGEWFMFEAGASNTGATTINITPSGGAARGAVAIQQNGSALTGGEIIAGEMYIIVYESTAAVWRLLGGANGFGTLALPGISFGGDLDTGFRRTAANASALVNAGADTLAITAAGEITMPLQPLVIARNSAGETNVTGAGTNHTLTFASETEDRNADFASPTLTFPVSGIYEVLVNATLLQVAAGHTRAFMQLVLTGQDVMIHDQPTIGVAATGRVMISGHAYVEATAADTMSVLLNVAGGADAIDIDADPLHTTALYARLVA